MSTVVYGRLSFNNNSTEARPSASPSDSSKQVSEELSRMVCADRQFLEDRNLQRVNFDADIKGNFLVINKIYMVDISGSVIEVEERHKFPLSGHKDNINHSDRRDAEGMPISNISYNDFKKAGALLLFAIGVIALVCLAKGKVFSPLGGTLVLLLSFLASYVFWTDAKADERKV